MPALTPWDHVYALAVFVVFPVYSKFTFARAMQKVRERGEPARLSVYRQVIVTWIAFAGLVLILWWYFDRAWADIGLLGGRPWAIPIGLVIAAGVVALTILPLHGFTTDPDGAGKLGDEIGDLIVMMPRSRREQAWFRAVSVNAGVTEELIFRGYLIWYLQAWLGLVWAAVIATVAFAFAHMYQGARQVPGVLLVSAVAVSLYLFTGSLLVPVLFHIALDVAQGSYIARILRASGTA